MNRVLATLLTAFLACSREAPSSESSTPRGDRHIQRADNAARHEVLQITSLPEAVARMVPWFEDVEAPSRYAALPVDKPEELFLVEWSKRHLTWKQLNDAPALDVEEQVGRGRKVRGAIGCVAGNLNAGDFVDGATRYELRDQRDRYSGGWIVGDVADLRARRVEVCGTVVGLRIYGNSHRNGLEIVGLSRLARDAPPAPE